MTHEPFDTEAAAYALGALEGEQLARFETHLAEGCARCLAALREAGDMAVVLAADAAPAVPPTAVREALLRRVAAEASPARRQAESARWWTSWATAAAAAVLVAALGGLFVQGRYEPRLAALGRETAALKEELERQARALGQRQADAAIAQMLRDPATRVLTLRGAGPIPTAEARLLWQQEAGGWLVVTNLPPAGAGNAYELWTISGGRPTPVGVVNVDASGRATHRVEPVAQAVDVFAVTVEPEAGVAAPTGPIVLASR